MIHPFKSTLKARSVLGIQAVPGFLGVVRVQNGMKGPRVTHAAYREFSAEEDSAEPLARLLEEDQGFLAESAAASLPSSSAELREVEAALSNPGKLARIIKYQVEELISLPIEETLVDFVPAGANGTVLAAALPKAELAGHLEALFRAGVDPDRVTLDDLALLALYRQIGGRNEAPGAEALIRLGPDRDGVLILRGGRLCLIRSLPPGPEGENALIEALRLDALRHPEAGVDSVLLTGPGALEPGRAEALEKRLGLPVSIWPSPGAMPEGASPLDAEARVRLSVPLGLALGAQDSTTERFNLRKEYFTKKSDAPDRRLVILFPALLLLLGLLFGFQLFQQNRALEARHDRIRAGMHDILTTTFPETPLVIKGQEAAQMEQKIQEQRARYAWLERIAPGKTVLDLLTLITATLTGNRDVTLDHVSMDDLEVHLDGRASSFQAVDAIKEKFEKGKGFSRVKLLSAKSDKGKGSVRFSFVLEPAS